MKTMKSDRMTGMMMPPMMSGMSAMPSMGMMPMGGMMMPGMMPHMMPGMMPNMMMGGMMGMPMMSSMPMGMSMGMMPRCKMEMKKVAGGMMMSMTCDDAAMCAMMHSMCDMMMGSGMPGMMWMMNGMPMCMMSMGMATCAMEKTEHGMTMTCTSGDKKMGEMLECMSCMMEKMMACGMNGCMMMNGMPMCCC